MVGIIFVTITLFEVISSSPEAYRYLGNNIVTMGLLMNTIHQKPLIKFPKKSSKIENKSFNISFSNVSFKYRKNYILENLSFEIREKENVLLSGESGSGKTTIVNLLSRFWEKESGKIKIGNIDLKNFTEQKLREFIGLIRQESYIFNTTIKNNLLIGDSNATEAKLWKTLESLDLGKFIASLPKKLDSHVGKRGCFLSQGQRRRIDLARVLLSKKPIIILDEPTEHLDSSVEKLVFEAIREFTRDRTLFMTSHRGRMNSYIKIDKIINL